MKTTLVIAFIVAMLAGCGLLPSGSESVPGQAEVVAYRPGRLTAFTNRYSLEMDGRTVAELVNGSFVRLRTAPGSHNFTVTDASGAAWSKTLEADTRYYLQLAVTGNAPNFEVALKQVPPDLAKTELEGLRELEAPPVAAER
ncbi:MAG: hypothetical protein ACRETN_08950 [Nevskiales bacterium]